MLYSFLNIAAASALVLVSAPALASPNPVGHQSAMGGRGNGTGSDANIHDGYRSASSEYVVADQKPVGSTAARPLRRILISGYHPVEGFEDEIAKERAAVASGSEKAGSTIASADR